MPTLWSCYKTHAVVMSKPEPVCVNAKQNHKPTTSGRRNRGSRVAGVVVVDGAVFMRIPIFCLFWRLSVLLGKILRA